MTPLGKFILRLALYGSVVAWIAGDLFVFHGPLRRRLDRANPASVEAQEIAKSNGVIARVFNHQITRSQLERALHERLWLEGKTPADLSPEHLRLARRAALEDLIHHELLRVKAKANASQLRVTDEEVNDRLRRLLGRFESKGAMETAMKAQGIASEAALRERITALIQQERYVELKIAPLAAVTEDEARAWFAENRDKLAHPLRVRVRHIFIATLERSSAEARAMLEPALAEIKAGADFAAVAARLSEDPASRTRGGDLGWMSRARLPVDFSQAVFSLPQNQPALLQTRIGWHLVEVTGRMPSATRDYDAAEAEVLAALEAIKRHRAAKDFRDGLRQFEAGKIQIYDDRLGEF